MRLHPEMAADQPFVESDCATPLEKVQVPNGIELVPAGFCSVRVNAVGTGCSTGDEVTVGGTK